MRIQLAGKDYTTFVNGPGCRSIVFLSGCRHACKGCYNKEFWSYTYGIGYDIRELVKDIGAYYNAHLIQGVTISGGEPFDQPEALEALVNSLIKIGIDDIWVYTGYLFEEARNISPFTIENIKVLVDGKFDISNKGTYRYKGSGNQRIIDCKRTLSSDSIKLYLEG